MYDLLDTPFGFASIDDDAEERDWRSAEYREFMETVREACKLPARPPHVLEATPMHGIAQVRHQIDLLLPRFFTKRDAHSYFLEHPKPGGMPYYMPSHGGIMHDLERTLGVLESSHLLPRSNGIQMDTVLEQYMASLPGAEHLREGYVDFPDRDHVTVQLPVRQYANLSPEQVAEGLYYQQFFCDAWNWNYGAPKLFAAIEKNLEGSATDDPFTWVLARMKIAAGYSVEGGGKDCSVPFLEQAYARMAPIVCNHPPASQERLRIYAIGEHERDLMTDFYAWHANHVCPEAVSFLLENAALLTQEDLRLEPLQNFFQMLPHAVSQGLHIDCVKKYAHIFVNGTSSAREQLFGAVSLTLAVWKGEKPWWFREDTDLAALVHSSLQAETAAHAVVDPKLVSALAHHAGFALPYALPVYKQAGYRIAELSPVTTDDALAFTAFVTERYGIGNPDRAVRVLTECESYLRVEEPAKRHERLQALKNHLEEVRPQSPIIGALEPQDAIFEFPGLGTFVFTALGKKDAGALPIHPLRVEAEHVLMLGKPLALPLGERARWKLALHESLEDMETVGLLPGQGGEARLALPIPESNLPDVPIQNPLLGVLDFYARLKEECGWNNTHVAHTYFAFCAPRMPDPWHPPKGFLRFLDDFEHIPDHRYRWIYLEHPDDREEVGRANMRHTVKKTVVISNILDAWVMGLLTEGQVQALCAWLTEKVDPSMRKITEQRIRAAHEMNDGDAMVPADLDFDAEPLSPEARAEQHEQWVQQAVESSCNEAERELQRYRLEWIKGAFSILSVINSLSAARFFTREKLAGLLQGRLLPPHVAATSTMLTSLPFGGEYEEALAAVTDLAENELVDHEAMHAALGQCASPDDAHRVVEAFMQNVERQLLHLSREIIGRHVEAIAQGIPALHDLPPLDAATELTTLLKTHRELAREELLPLWDRRQFIVHDVVEKLLRDEFRVDRYIGLFTSLHKFNREVLPKALPVLGDSSLLADVQGSNEHSARIFAFVGLRYISEHMQAGVEGPFERLEHEHGAHSHIDVTGGLHHVTDGVRQVLEGSSLHEKDQAVARLFQDLPRYQEQVDRWRLGSVPLGPVGGRWHFSNPVSDRHLRLFKELLGLGQTAFRMIHSNTSLIVPGFMSRQEMKAFILMLALEGLVDPNKPELQVGVPGRLDPNLCAYFGSSAILGTAECAPFRPNSFVAGDGINNWHSGARIVAYDAYEVSNGRNLQLPFMCTTPEDIENADGRTDVLGRWHVRLRPREEAPTVLTMDDIDIAHVVGAALRHVQKGGVLREAGVTYMQRHRAILGKYNLLDTLDAPWVFTREGEAYDAAGKFSQEHFDRCVQPCMQTHFSHAAAFHQGSGAVYEVRENIDMLLRQVETVRAAVLRDPRWEPHVQALLQATTSSRVSTLFPS